jgi:tol-pal system protein YbgF
MKKILIPLLMAMLFAGCASSSDVRQIQTQINDLTDEIADLKRQASSKAEVQRLNENVVRQTDTLLKSSADLSVRVAEFDDRLQNVQGSVEQTNYRVDRIVQQLSQAQRDLAELRQVVRPNSASGGQPAVEEITVQSSGGGDPVELYQSAYRDYQRGNYDLAIEGFREFVANNATSDLADNAAYWTGEALFSQKKYRDAVQQFDRVINQYPKSDKVPAALLKKGYAYIELGEKAQGVVQLQYVVHEHPKSQEATLARQKLKSLGIESR